MEEGFLMVLQKRFVNSTKNTETEK